MPAMRPSLWLPGTALLLGSLHAQEPAPPELGRVRWGRDLDAALARCREDGRPVFLLFQEVPG